MKLVEVSRMFGAAASLPELPEKQHPSEKPKFKNAGEYIEYNTYEFNGKIVNKLINDVGDLCLWDANLSSLEGCPKVIGGDFYCNNNKLTSLDGCPEEVGRDNHGSFDCSGNQIKDLKDIHLKLKKMDGTLVCGEKIKSHVLGLFLNGCRLLVENDNSDKADGDSPPWVALVNIFLKAIHEDRSNAKEEMYKCQEALIHHGFEPYAHV